MQTMRTETCLPARSGAIAVLAVLLVLIIVLLPSFNGDFHDFYMAGQLLLRGDSPYIWPRYYSPIWVAASVAPLTVLPERFAYTVFTLVRAISDLIYTKNRLNWIA